MWHPEFGVDAENFDQHQYPYDYDFQAVGDGNFELSAEIVEILELSNMTTELMSNTSAILEMMAYDKYMTAGDVFAMFLAQDEFVEYWSMLKAQFPELDAVELKKSALKEIDNAPSWLECWTMILHPRLIFTPGTLFYSEAAKLALPEMGLDYEMLEEEWMEFWMAPLTDRIEYVQENLNQSVSFNEFMTIVKYAEKLWMAYKLKGETTSNFLDFALMYIRNYWEMPKDDDLVLILKLWGVTDWSMPWEKTTMFLEKLAIEWQADVSMVKDAITHRSSLLRLYRAVMKAKGFESTMLDYGTEGLYNAVNGDMDTYAAILAGPDMTELHDMLVNMSDESRQLWTGLSLDVDHAISLLTDDNDDLMKIDNAVAFFDYYVNTVQPFTPLTYSMFT